MEIGVPEWVATIETERGQIILGIQNNSQVVEIIGKYEDGFIEKMGQTAETREMALESIGMMYGGGLWFLEWLN